MRWLAVFFGLMIFAMGGAGMADPMRLMAFVTRFRSRKGFWTAAAVRVVMGVVLILAAEGARAPLFLQIIGWAALAAGLLLPFIGLARYQAIIDWWLAKPEGFQRAWAGAAIIFGASLAWAALP